MSKLIPANEKSLFRNLVYVIVEESLGLKKREHKGEVFDVAEYLPHMHRQSGDHMEFAVSNDIQESVKNHFSKIGFVLHELKPRITSDKRTVIGIKYITPPDYKVLAAKFNTPILSRSRISFEEKNALIKIIKGKVFDSTGASPHAFNRKGEFKRAGVKRDSVETFYWIDFSESDQKFKELFPKLKEEFIKDQVLLSNKKTGEFELHFSWDVLSKVYLGATEEKKFAEAFDVIHGFVSALVTTSFQETHESDTVTYTFSDCSDTEKVEAFLVSKGIFCVPEKCQVCVSLDIPPSVYPTENSWTSDLDEDQLFHAEMKQRRSVIFQKLRHRFGETNVVDHNSERIMVCKVTKDSFCRIEVVVGKPGLPTVDELKNYIVDTLGYKIDDKLFFKNKFIMVDLKELPVPKVEKTEPVVEVEEKGVASAEGLTPEVITVAKLLVASIAAENAKSIAAERETIKAGLLEELERKLEGYVLVKVGEDRKITSIDQDTTIRIDRFPTIPLAEVLASMK